MNHKDDKKGTYSTPKPTAPEASSSSMTLFASARGIEPTAVPVDAVTSTENATIYLPVMIAVKKGQTIAMDADHPSTAVKVCAIGSKEQKQSFITALQSNTQDLGAFITRRTELACYQVWDLASQERFVSLTTAYLIHSNMILIFGQNNIRATLSTISEQLKSQFDFYATKNNAFEKMDDLSKVMPESLETGLIDPQHIDGFLDATHETMKLTYHVSAEVVEADQTLYQYMGRYLGF